MVLFSSSERSDHALIKSILIQEYQNKSRGANTSPARVNTNQHEFGTIQHESSPVRHESTRINTSLTRVNRSLN